MSNSNKTPAEEVKIIKYNLDAAYAFYKKFIYNQEHQELLKQYGFHVAGSIAAINWEVFTAILTGDIGKVGYGADLIHHEVKSSVEGNSYEYQYHFKGGQTKLQDDMKVNHIFISYSPDYKNIEVRIVGGAILKPTFESWLPGLIANYEGPNRRQRYRKSISYGFIKNQGILILKTRNGELIQNI